MNDIIKALTQKAIGGKWIYQEMKYSINPFSIDKRYAEELRNKIGVFRQETNTRKSVFLTMITTFGLKTNSYSAGLVQNDLRMDVLFTDLKLA